MGRTSQGSSLATSVCVGGRGMGAQNGNSEQRAGEKVLVCHRLDGHQLRDLRLLPALAGACRTFELCL